VGFLFEYLGVTFGWIFGSYYYTNTSPLFFNKLPLATPFSWAFMVYVCYTTSVYILQPLLQASASALFLVPIYTGLLCVTLDLLIDPVATDPRIRGWIWLKTGRYFGIPLSNFIGWFATGLTSTTLFAVYNTFCNGNIPMKTELGAFSVFAYLTFFSMYISYAIALRKYNVILVSASATLLVFILSIIVTY